MKYELLADLDSLLFELNSACDLMCSLFEKLHTLAGKPMPAKSVEASLGSLLKVSGIDPTWFTALDKNRNFFIHEGAPYVAVDISAPPAYDLLIMKENLKSFEDEDKFTRLSQISNMYRGFVSSVAAVQLYLVRIFA